MISWFQYQRKFSVLKVDKDMTLGIEIEIVPSCSVKTIHTDADALLSRVNSVTS